MEISTPEKFRLWYVNVFSYLEHQTPGGSGAIIALAAALPLYERWVVANVSSPGRASRHALISSDLRISDLVKTAKFWNVFRDGLSHTGSFFRHSKTQRDECWPHLPKVGLSKDYPSFPQFIIDPNTGLEVILLNPWGLIAHILEKYERNPSLLEGADAPLLPLSG
jgi:hypothetical protein